MSQHIRSPGRAFIACRSGSFGVALAISAMPAAALLGLAMDYSRIFSAQSRLQSAVDAATLAAASSGAPVHIMQNTVTDMIAVNFDAAPVAVKTVVETHEICASAKGEIALPVMALAGRPAGEIEAAACVRSAEPLRRGTVATSAGYDGDAARRTLREALAKLPARQRAEFERQLENHLKAVRKQTAGEALRLAR